MNGWTDILHFDFHGEHVLFHSLRLSSTRNFIIASAMTIMLCSLEKLVFIPSLWGTLIHIYSQNLSSFTDIFHTYRRPRQGCRLPIVHDWQMQLSGPACTGS